MELTYQSATPENFDQLVELRIDAMKESLEAIGRFNRERSVERFKASFRSEDTKLIKHKEALIGFFAVSEKEDHFYIDHLYIAPRFQSSGIGTSAINEIVDVSEKSGLPIRLGALKSSKSNDFYQRHGFVVTHEDEFDIYYERKTRANKQCPQLQLRTKIMNMKIQIKPFESETHQDEVIELWVRVFGYETAHNEPSLVIRRKEEMNDGLFFVSVSSESKVTGTVMCGYDGHRGWIYALAVSPNLQRSGIGTALINHAETALKTLGCMKINLQIMEGNEKVQAFYETCGYTAEKRVSMGKQIPTNTSKHQHC